MRLMRYCGKIL